MAMSTVIFSWNSAPVIPRRFSLANSNGIPASSVPAGQMYLQKAGTLTPVFIKKYSGMAITKTSKITYFSSEAARVTVLFFNFGEGILWISSWMRPKGHKNPQMLLPKRTPNNSSVPTT